MKWLFAFIFLFTFVNAEEITTGNLITNGNFETGNANSWTTTGDVQVLSDCCELNGVSSNYDVEFGDSGSIEQDFNLSTNTITQNMLDNGITLDSSIDAQNGECSVAGCWGGRGDADTFTNVLTIKDSDGNTLASNTTIRTDVTGIDGAIFTDRLIYNGTGSNVGNINISGSDANAPANLGGPNIDNISVTMTYDDTVIAVEIVEEIEEVFEEPTTEAVAESTPIEQMVEAVELDLKPLKANVNDLKLEVVPNLNVKSMVIATKSIDLDFAVEASVLAPTSLATSSASESGHGSAQKVSKSFHENKIFHEHQVDERAKRTSNKAPRYPLIAKRRGISGKVVIDCIVTITGEVTNYKIVESQPKGIFEKSCLAVLSDLRYKPAMKSGRFVAQRTLLTFEFGIR